MLDNFYRFPAEVTRLRIVTSVGWMGDSERSTLTRTRPDFNLIMELVVASPSIPE